MAEPTPSDAGGTYDDLRNRYVSLYREEGISDDERRQIAKSLDLQLPGDFLKISTFYGGGVIAGISVLELSASDTENVVTETKRLREAVGLRNCFLVIAQLNESIIVMSCANNEQFGQVFWADNQSIEQFSNSTLIETKLMCGTWSSFFGFFKFLVDEEERNRT